MESLYQKRGSTISSIARHYDTSQPTVRKWLIHYGIERKSHAQASLEANNRRSDNPPSRDELLADYKCNSVDWIERKYGVGQSTVYSWLSMYDIKTGSRTILTSSRQRELFDLISRVDPEGEWVMNDRKLIYPQELDIVSHKHRTAIEYCGLYWHSEIHKKDTYHVDKLERCEQAGYRLVTVFESDDIEMVVRLITRPTLSVGARECSIVHDADLGSFEKEHHLMGACNAGARIALMHGGKIVASMSFSRSRYDKDMEWEMIRYTTGDVAVVGGGARLLKAFVARYAPRSIVTYCDRRYGVGRIYPQLGFVFSHNTAPNYWYCKAGKTELLSRQMFMKHKLPKMLERYDADKTERVNMLNNNYYRVYDCGSSVWKMVL